MTHHKISVLIADDQDLVRGGFAMILSTENHIEVVGQAKDGAQAVALAQELKPDIVLMDVQMPRLNGIEATAQICASLPDTRVLILTTFDREDYLFDSLKAGASGFLLKTCGADELITALEKIAEGHALLSPEMTVPLIEKLVAETQPVPVEKGRTSPSASVLEPHEQMALETLTPRELEILDLLGQGKTNAEIAEELFLGVATVKTHVANVLAKTLSRDRVSAAIFALKTGVTNFSR